MIWLRPSKGCAHVRFAVRDVELTTFKSLGVSGGSCIKGELFAVRKAPLIVLLVLPARLG